MKDMTGMKCGVLHLRLPPKFAAFITKSNKLLSTVFGNRDMFKTDWGGARYLV